MSMIEYKRVNTEKELHQLLELQKRNLKSNLSELEIASQGFVTVHHSFEVIYGMHLIEPSVIAKNGDEVISYVIAMTEASKDKIPVLIPMFEVFNEITFHGKKISEYNYIVVGQVCVDYKYRGLKIFDNVYAYYKETFKEKYSFAITEIALENKRSLNAHSRIGFNVVHEFKDAYGIEWAVVLWEF